MVDHHLDKAGDTSIHTTVGPDDPTPEQVEEVERAGEYAKKAEENLRRISKRKERR